MIIEEQQEEDENSSDSGDSDDEYVDGQDNRAPRPAKRRKWAPVQARWERSLLANNK